MRSTLTPPRRALHPAAWWLGLGLVPVTAVVIARAADPRVLATVVDTLLARPAAAVGVLGIYGTAFVLRASAWSRTLPALRLGQALAAIHVSVGANHVLPLRLGEVLRVTSVLRRTDVRPAAAVASTVTLRAIDILAVGALAAVVGPGLLFEVLGAWGPVLLAVATVTVLTVGVWAARRRPDAGMRAPGPVTLGLVLVSWMLEGVVVHQAAAWAGIGISAAEAVLVTAVTIVAQVAAIAPGGLGTYEAAATAALVAVGVPPGAALAIAVTAHATKTAYALVTGAVAVAWPRPSLLGRLRLPAPSHGPAPERLPGAAGGASGAAATPVVLFLPAHDEEAAVGAVVRRAPRQVAGHPVICLVIDDGSTDRTAERARSAGAEVVSLGGNHGLGAAVRRGLAEALERDAVAVAFCDADGEYAPEELERLVAPILDGRADYVVGSRFAGTIGRMLPHRRLGNHVLTAALRFVTRTPITDGQSGYRALSRRAAAHARVIHDFNYAQVLTIDLLARGARYAEVPISYRFRDAGRSFVRLGRYLAAVVPAVHRQLNAEVAPLWQTADPRRPLAAAHPRPADP